MKTIFQILQEKEEQVRVLQAQIEKLRAAAEIVAQEQGTAVAAPSASDRPSRSAAVATPNTEPVVRANVEPATSKKIWP